MKEVRRYERKEGKKKRKIEKMLRASGFQAEDGKVSEWVFDIGFFITLNVSDKDRNYLKKKNRESI